MVAYIPRVGRLLMLFDLVSAVALIGGAIGARLSWGPPASLSSYADVRQDWRLWVALSCAPQQGSNHRRPNCFCCWAYDLASLRTGAKTAPALLSVVTA